MINIDSDMAVVVDTSQNDEVNLVRVASRPAPAPFPLLRRNSPSHHSHPFSGPSGSSTTPAAVGANIAVPREVATRPVIDIPVASARIIEAWQLTVFQRAGRCSALRITAATAEEAAEALLSLIESRRSATPFTPPLGVNCAQSALLSFIQRHHDIQMYVIEIVALPS